jgi:hypothetical protein
MRTARNAKSPSAQPLSRRQRRRYPVIQLRGGYGSGGSARLVKKASTLGLGCESATFRIITGLAAGRATNPLQKAAHADGVIGALLPSIPLQPPDIGIPAVMSA